MKKILIAAVIYLLAAVIAPSARAAVSPEDARAAYARLQSLAGEWRSKSTKGWTESLSFTLVGKGSALLELSHFADTPQEAMATVFHLDGGRLLLTHYCEAKNQPRLVATEVSDGGRVIIFSFLDGTGLDEHPGHMHAVRLRIVDADHVTSQWSFFRDGKEQWMEEIVSERVSR
jgi:hypothetical protein